MRRKGLGENIEQWVQGKEVGLKTIIGEDFNARTGREGGKVQEVEEEDREEEGDRRQSKDEMINKEERILLVEFVEERRWSSFNGNITGDEEGEYTFTGGKGCTVIDYVMGDRKVR